MTDRTGDGGQFHRMRFLTPQQVADELVTTSSSTIRGLIASGALPVIQIGGRGQWRIKRTCLEDYISEPYATARTDLARDDVDVDGQAWPESSARSK